MSHLRALLCLTIIPAAAAQNTPRPAAVCGPPPALLQSTQPNIFSEQQEQWLGDAEADMLERDNRPIKDPAQNAYLESIGKRLLAVLPPTTIQFHFVMVDSSEINGFSLAGGRVYVTRKLVANARSEDEIAGVMAHEMGHILTHQFAYETTDSLKRLLNITSVGDRADIYAKFQKLVDAEMRDKHAKDADSDDKQDQADRVSVYAIAAAGYRPQAYSEFWDRSFFVGGKTGNSFSDFFGATKPNEKRLRLLRKMVADLPSTCGPVSPPPETAAAFQKWHNDVVANQASTPVAASLPAQKEVALTPPLRLDMEKVRFSRDGKYILAQDESSISVATANPLRVLFRFDAERAQPADFTPDSQQIVFYTPGLHVERWSIADRKLVTAREMVVPHPCLQTVMSPDGHTLACISWGSGSSLDFNLFDADTNSSVFQQKDWFQASYIFGLMLVLHDRFGTAPLIIPSSFSSDGNILLIGPSSSKLAFDLRTRTPIKIGGPLKSDVDVTYAFQGNDKVLGITPSNTNNSGIFSFPDGKRLQQMKLSLATATTPAHGDYFLIPGPKGYVSAVVDLSTSKYLAVSRIAALDIFDDTVATQEGDGTLLTYKAPLKDPTQAIHVSLPLSPLGPARAVALSPDGRYLALSARLRGGVWDLSTGHEIYLTRGFTSASYTSDGNLLIEYPAVKDDDKLLHHMASADPVDVKKFADFDYKLEDREHLESGRLLEWKSDKKSYSLVAHSPKDNSVQWTRVFPDEQPGYTINQADNDLIFSVLMQSNTGKEKLKSDATLKTQAAQVKFKDAGRIIEIADPATGKTRSQVVVEVPVTYPGVEGFTHLGDQLYLSVDDNRTIVYSLQTGAQLRQVFGVVVATDIPSERIATINRRDELVVYDCTGAELQHLKLGSTVRFAALENKGAQLVVLTADQKVRHFNIDPKPQLSAAN